MIPIANKFRAIADWLDLIDEEWNDTFKSFKMIEDVYDAIQESGSDALPDRILNDVDWEHPEDFYDDIQLALKVDDIMHRTKYHNMVMKHYQELLHKR